MSEPVPDPTSQSAVVAAAAGERRSVPTSAPEAADLADTYDRMMRLASLFDTSGEEMRQRSRLGTDLLADPAFVDSAPLSPPTYLEAESQIRAATTGKHGLLSRSIELDADALVLRATVLTYRWIDELQQAAYQTLGSIAGRAIGYLAPEVALGGAIVSAGLIETDALDRDSMAAYLNELADSNPELMEHVTSGGGGLLDGLRMRSLLTAGVLAGDQGRLAGRGGLRAVGIEPFPTGAGPALRDVAVTLVEDPPTGHPDGTDGHDAGAPATLTALLGELAATSAPVVVRRVAPSRYIAYLAGRRADDGPRLRLLNGSRSGYAAQVVEALERAVGDDAGAHVMLVGAGPGGVVAAEVAAGPASPRFTVDQVVTAGAPSAHVPRLPAGTRMLSLEDRADPIALLGSLINAGLANRVTVVYDQDPEPTDPARDAGRSPARDARGDGYLAGGRAADAATHPDLVAEIAHLRELGFLADAP